MDVSYIYGVGGASPKKTKVTFGRKRRYCIIESSYKPSLDIYQKTIII